MNYKAILGAAVVVATAAGAAMAQAPTPGAQSGEAATRQVMMPQWSYGPGESWLTFRNPLDNFYMTIGGHAGISRNTSLLQVGREGCPNLVAGCNQPQPLIPTGDLGPGGGGSLGVGARVTPMFRAALIGTAEGGYRFKGSARFPADPNTETFASTQYLQVPVRSFQATGNLYADFGGLLSTGRWNPYLMGGIGVAVNQTHDFSVASVSEDIHLRPSEATFTGSPTSHTKIGRAHV